ncbi:hypothetical protein [Microbacterium sp. AK031]|uniref:hypothetical protein n=1 Tax=Microbacterium sp. AK031 TaxID=2723076 RepID=UPI002168DE8D|nr:hypothetical protein [Microbacterium sp. AK031]MCS3843513.1 hypothetical protein [Microbacterium sp. AK031]
MPDNRDQPPRARATANSRATRRIELTMHKPWFAMYAAVRPTLVIAGRGQPTQWGLGTWQVPAEETVTIGVFLFNRVWRFGQAEFTLESRHAASLTYRAPALPFLPGRIHLDTEEHAPR